MEADNELNIAPPRTVSFKKNLTWSKDELMRALRIVNTELLHSEEDRHNRSGIRMSETPTKLLDTDDLEKQNELLTKELEQLQAQNKQLRSQMALLAKRGKNAQSSQLELT